MGCGVLYNLRVELLEKINVSFDVSDCFRELPLKIVGITIEDWRNTTSKLYQSLGRTPNHGNRAPQATRASVQPAAPEKPS